MDVNSNFVPNFNIINRVVKIRNKNTNVIGVGLIFPVNSNEYLITSSHLVDTSNKLEVILRGGPLDIQIERHRMGNPNLVEEDYSVFILKNRIFTDGYLPISFIGPRFFGQDVWFFGYPYGIDGGYVFDGKERNEDNPLPIVKRGIISSLPNQDRPYYLIEGIGNPGYSGGPVITRNEQNVNVPLVLGLVQGFLLGPNNQPTGLIKCTSLDSVVAGIMGIPYEVPPIVIV